MSGGERVGGDLGCIKRGIVGVGEGVTLPEKKREVAKEERDKREVAKYWKERGKKRKKGTKKRRNTREERT